MNEMSLWLIVFVKIVARGGVKGRAGPWHISVYGRLLCILVLLNLNNNVSNADSRGWPVSCLFWEWQVTAVLSMAAGLVVYLHVSADFEDKKKLGLQKQRYMHPPTNFQAKNSQQLWVASHLPARDDPEKISSLWAQEILPVVRLTWIFGFMIMVTTVSFQLSPVSGGIKSHVRMDLFKHSRQNPSHVQKQDNCICVVCLGSLTLLTLGWLTRSYYLSLPCILQHFQFYSLMGCL